MAEVKIKSGWIRGIEGEGYHGFLGIPYAKPPVGELRWKHPQPVEPWEGVRDAVKLGSPCCQAPSQVVPGGDPDDRGVIDNGSEDCLYINVFTPDLKKTKMPVYLWIHGGAYCCGSGGGHNIRHEPFTSRGIVYVSFNYRLGIMGFFAHPELSKENEHHVSGNYGHFDQLAALKWVVENIGAFGGDPDNITVGGSSAGAGSTQLLCNSPLSRGLIKKAVVISSMGLATPAYPEEDKLKTMEDMEARGVEFMELLGCHTISELRALSYEELIRLPESSFRRKYHYGTSIGTNLDGYLLPVFYKESNEACTNENIPYLTGCTNDEGGEHILRMGRQRFIDQSAAVFGSQIDEYLEICNITDDASAVQAARATHLKFVGAKIFAEKSAMMGKEPVYLFDFCRKHPEKGYANHGITTKYMFGSYKKLPHAKEEDDRVSETLQAYLGNFIKNGDPNGRGLPKWDPYSAQNRCVCYIDVETVCKKDEEAENPIMALTREFLEDKILGERSE